MSSRIVSSMRASMVSSVRLTANSSSASPILLSIHRSRALSSTPINRLATPQTGPTRAGYAPAAELGSGAAPIVPKRAEIVPDYSKGPSALDKASSLFFFTEIVRGEFVGDRKHFQPRARPPLQRTHGDICGCRVTDADFRNSIRKRRLVKSTLSGMTVVLEQASPTRSCFVQNQLLTGSAHSQQFFRYAVVLSSLRVYPQSANSLTSDR